MHPAPRCCSSLQSLALASVVCTLVTSAAVAHEAIPQKPGVYQIPLLPSCDPRTIAGGNSWFDWMTAGASDTQSAPWDVLRPALGRDPPGPLDQLDLARCYYLFFRDVPERPRLDEVEDLLGRVLTTVRAARAAAAPRPQPAPGQPLRVGGSVAPPARTHEDPVRYYPAAAARQGISGAVILDIVIDRSGGVRDARVVGSIPELDQAALDAVRKMKFAKTTVGGKAVEVSELFAVRFDPGKAAPALDAIDLARFHLAQGNFAEAESHLGTALARLRSERQASQTATPGPSRPPVVLRFPNASLDPPTVVQRVVPTYTQDAMKAKRQGAVSLDVLLGADGRVLATRVTKSLDAELGLDMAAVIAARQWRFNPAKDRSGAPVPVIVQLVLEFRLH